MLVSPVFDKAIQRALVMSGFLLEHDAKLLAPVDTGRLRDSITFATKSERSRPEPDAKAMDGVSRPASRWELYVGTNVEYAAHQEYGTNQIRSKSVGMVAQPYLRPSLDANRNNVRDIFRRELSKAMKDGK